MVLPNKINQANAVDFLSLISRTESAGDFNVDFTNLKFASPGALVALACTVARWQGRQIPVNFSGINSCTITNYLKRMNLFRILGQTLPENFRRHNPSSRFFPLQRVDEDVGQMGTAIADCIAPGGDEWDHPMADMHSLAWYVLTEIGNNIRQHSWGDGFVCAQKYKEDKDVEIVQLAFADDGIGILGSFSATGASWANGMHDADAIEKALEPRVSCKAGDPNEGVGLTLVSELVRLTKGWLTIVSGNGVLKIEEGQKAKKSVLPDDGRYHGTFFEMGIRQQSANGFHTLLRDAKIHAGLLNQGSSGARFDS